MDNLSHSVVGLVAGEIIHRSLTPEPDNDSNRLRRRLLLITGWLSCNFPDLDLVLTPLLPPPLGYLLHHRGHTHTVLYAIPQALLLAAMIWLLWPAARRLLGSSAGARKGFVLALGAGFGLHLLMDFLNSYGIHPFHPFDSHWLYGDLVFILEPVFWVAFGVPLAMMVRRLPLRILYLALLLGVPLYFTTRGYLPWASTSALMALAALLGWLQLRAGERGKGALAGAVAVLAVFLIMQGVAAEQGRRAIAQALQERDPASRIHDTAMTAFPANPFCWIFASVESNEAAGSYRLRRGVVSTLPALVPVAACPPALADGVARRQATPAIAFLSEQQGSLPLLRELKRDNCHFDAWLRFARLPALTREAATDIRFAGSPRGNFTTLRFEDFAGRACESFVPQWERPREDLLGPPH